jgi:hypothetical protein
MYKPVSDIYFYATNPMQYFLIFVFVLFVSNVNAAEQYPYTGTITAGNVTVHSGPGAGFYPTSQLQAGDKVEIFYEKGDWCAIRPPIGSFSWVSAKYVDLGSGNIGTVLAGGLASRIGSEETEDCETVQVKLSKGEKVFVLDRRETPENETSPLWLKITPPSGEFRWIPRSALLPPTARNRYTSTNTDITQAQYERETTSEPVLPPPTRPIRIRRQTEPVNNTVPELPLTVLPEPSQADPKVASALSVLDQQAVAPSLVDQNLDPFQKAFVELKEEARIVMSRPTEDEVFDLLIQRANDLYEVAPTDQDLEKTYHLLETLQRTRVVRQELTARRSFAVPTAPVSPVNRSLLPTALTTNSSTPAPRAGGIGNNVVQANTPAVAAPLQAGINIGGYDIVGRLGEFDPLPKGHPPFAVVDDKEQIICLVSPSAGLDLELYVGRFVGINGVLGFYEKPGNQKAKHVTVKNIRAIK